MKVKIESRTIIFFFIIVAAVLVIFAGWLIFDYIPAKSGDRTSSDQMVVIGGIGTMLVATASFLNVVYIRYNLIETRNIQQRRDRPQLIIYPDFESIRTSNVAGTTPIGGHITQKVKLNIENVGMQPALNVNISSLTDIPEDAFFGPEWPGRELRKEIDL